MTSLDNGRRSPKKLLRAVVARLLGRAGSHEGQATAGTSAAWPLREAVAS
jgi:hypothetical protein